MFCEVTVRNIHELSLEELSEIVTEIQGIAFRDRDHNREFWNPEKSLGADFIGDVCDLLAQYGLRPETEQNALE